jgi:V/A-type H+-transporting ATPase subunit E
MAAQEKNKIKEIVDILKKDGVDAGKSEAEHIKTEANKEAEQIKKDALQEKENIIAQARDEAKKLQSSAEANVRMAISQGISKFKESIEKSLLSPTLMESIQKSMDGKTVKDMILIVVKAYAEQGFSTNDLKIILGENEKKELKSSIMNELNSKIKDTQGIEISNEIIPEGVKLVQKDGNLSLEFTTESIKEVMLNYIRPEFRDLFFKSDENSKGE